MEKMDQHITFYEVCWGFDQDCPNRKSGCQREDGHYHQSTCSKAKDIPLRNSKQEIYLTQEKVTPTAHIRVTLWASRAANT